MPGGDLETHKDVVKFLSSPAAFDDGSRTVDVITTHGAVVFLGDRDVFKIKQPVAYEYMDFSTLERRRQVCEREIALNRPFAPSIYLDVKAITREADGGLAIDGYGEIVEWAVHMRRFDERHVLENLARSGALGADLANRLGETLVDYHAGLPVERTGDGAQRIKEIIDELGRAFADLGPVFPAGRVDAFDSGCAAAFASGAAHLDMRAMRGFVRRCHGDLHLRNLVLIDGVPTPFDALEFNERLATTDVLYDLAFLIMDMLHLDMRGAANRVFNRYVRAGWEFAAPQGFAVMPLFLALRAGIRAMVSAQTALRDPDHSAASNEEAGRYLDQAVAFLQRREPVLVAVAGLSGTGKSTLAADLAPLFGAAPGAVLLRSDLERKQMFDVPDLERLPAETYTREASDRVYARLIDKASIALEQGQAVILDAVFSTPGERYAAQQLANRAGAPFRGLWLDAPTALLRERVAGRHGDASDADVTVVDLQAERFQTLTDGEAGPWITVDASGSRAATLTTARALLASDAFGSKVFSEPLEA
ncbi:MAG: AAA family ATPase [Pseudomonadota bacterium]